MIAYEELGVIKDIRKATKISTLLWIKNYISTGRDINRVNKQYRKQIKVFYEKALLEVNEKIIKITEQLKSMP